MTEPRGCGKKKCIVNIGIASPLSRFKGLSNAVQEEHRSMTVQCCQGGTTCSCFAFAPQITSACSSFSSLPLSVHEHCMQLWYTQCTYTPNGYKFYISALCTVVYKVPQPRMLYSTRVATIRTCWHQSLNPFKQVCWHRDRLMRSNNEGQQSALQYTCRITDKKIQPTPADRLMHPPCKQSAGATQRPTCSFDLRRV